LVGFVVILPDEELPRSELVDEIVQQAFALRLLPNAVSSSIALLIIVDLVHASAAGSNEEDVVVVVLTFVQSIIVVLFVILVLTVMSESVFLFFEGFVFVK
jgi:hypothetical protein